MDKLLLVDSDVYQKVPKLYERTEKTLQQDVDIIKEWLKSQPHLPEIMIDHYIRNFLILNKCSIEKTKKKIDMYYTVRSIIPEIYDRSNPKLAEWREMERAVDWLILPKLTEDMYRVAILRVRDPELFQKLDATIQLSYVYNIYEIRLAEDYMYGDIVILDFNGVSFSCMAKWSPAYFTKTFFIYDNVYSSRLKAIYMVNSPSFVGTLLTIMKAVLKPKIFGRIQTFPNMEKLTELIAPDVLPPEYGGTGVPIDELKELWRQKFDQYQDRFDTLDKIRVDEKSRPEDLKNDEILGFYGNFKKLTVD